MTKRADGKVQKTLTIPGTGVSFVDIAGKSEETKARRNARARVCRKCGMSCRNNSAAFCQRCGHALQKGQ